MFVDPEFEKLVKPYYQDRKNFYMKKIITTVALVLAAISAAHGVIGDNPLQLAARFTMYSGLPIDKSLYERMLYAVDRAIDLADERFDVPQWTAFLKITHFRCVDIRDAVLVWWKCTIWVSSRF